jgi:peptide/nickel transport system substrate-binding protein
LQPLVRLILGLIASVSLSVAAIPDALTPFAAAHAASYVSLPSGELRYALHVTLAPAWFDPADTPAQLIPFAVLYALHDALIRPVPGARLGPALAESWHESVDGLSYEFTLRSALKFHNGTPCTADDVYFSFMRYQGAGARELHAKVKSVEIVDARTLRFHLHSPWPDFLTFYGTTATAAGVVVPKAYLEQVGAEGFKRHPVGLGPYKFVSYTPGGDLLLEAFEEYWRKSPHIKRLIIQGVPESTTRLAMLKRQETDFAFGLEAQVAEAVRNDPQLQLVAVQYPATAWVEFLDQWDSKSPWADQKVRLAANYAIDRQAINEAACLGLCPLTGVIIPRDLDYAMPLAPLPHDPPKARQLLAEAGYPDGFDAGELSPLPPFYVLGEAMVNDLNAVGIRVKMHTMERAAFDTARRAKKLRGLLLAVVGLSGNAATRVEAFIYTKGTLAYGGYPDIDTLFEQQAKERHPGQRAALLHRIQQLTAERAIFLPLMDYRHLVGVGPRVAVHALNTMPNSLFPALEDIELKVK